MRVSLPWICVAALVLSACPSNRQPAGEGEGEAAEGEGEGEGEVSDTGCDVDGATLAVSAGQAAATLADGSAVDTSCITTPRVVGPSTQVTLEGCVDIFGVGNSAQRGIVVSVFPEDGSTDPSTDEPLASGQVFIKDDAGGLDCAGADANAPACRAFDCDSRGFYRLTTTIPTHVPLTMRIAAESSTNVIDTYLWGLVFFDDAAVDGVINYEAALIFRSTWDSIPTLSGRQITGGANVSDGVGRAVVAGEVHDCSDTVVQNAVVGISDFDRSTMTIAYFDGNEDPKPDLLRKATATDGLYGILNVPTDAGANTFTVAAGYVDSCDGDACQCVSLSSRTIHTFPDSVSIATMRGAFPVIQ